jgi:hypothetical protein
MQQARELLAPIYAWFTEGFEEAKALLELRQSERHNAVAVTFARRVSGSR